MVELKREEKEKHVLEFEVEVEKERVDEVLEEVYRDFNQRVAVPGFRKGRTPRAILRARLGKEVVLDELVHRLVPKIVTEVLEKEDMEIVDEPDVEVLHVEEGEPLRFRFRVVENPSVVLARPEEIEVCRYRLEIRESDVDESVEDFRRRLGEWREKEGPIGPGDMVIVEMEGKKFSLVAGYDSRPVNSGIIGMKRGEKRRVSLEEGEEKEIEVLAVFERHLPELDGEFLKALGERYASLENFRAEVRKSLEERVKNLVEERLQKEAIAALCRGSQVEIPSPLVEEETRSVIEGFRKQLEESGITLERYLEITGKDFAAFEEEMQNVARLRIKKQLVLGQYAKEYGIELTKEELEHLVADIAQQSGKSPDKVVENLSKRKALPQIAAHLFTHKLIADLLSRVKVKEVDEPLNLDQWRALGDPEEEMIQG
ncbi:MAG: trigger factor [Candidatus Caldatribacteriaceae bacterium]